MTQQKNLENETNGHPWLLVFLVAAWGACAYFMTKYQPVFVPEEKTPRPEMSLYLPAPEKGPHLGAYLAGTMARVDGNSTQAANYYARALRLDPDNKTLLAQTYATMRDSGHFLQMLVLSEKMQALDIAPSETAYIRFAGLVKKGDYAAALDILQTKPGVFAPDAALRIWCLIGMGDTVKALREWNALDVRSKKADTTRLQKALIADYLGKATDAEKAFLSLAELKEPTINALSYARSFLKKRNKWDSTHPLYGLYLDRLKETDALATALDSMSPPDITSPVKGMAEVFHGLMIDAVAAGNLNTGLLAALIIDYLNPESPFARIFSAQMYEVLEMYPQANQEYDALPYFDIFALKKAINLMDMGQVAEGLAAIETIKPRFSHDETVQLVLAEAYLREKRYADAIHHYNLFMSLVSPQSPDWVMALFARGVAYHESGNWVLAEHDLATAAEQAMDNPIILNYIGYLWLTQDKNIDKAVSLIEKAVDITPNDPNFLDSLALGYYKQQKFPEALALAERATDMLPQSATVNEHLGDIYAALGRNREAQYQYKKALSLDTELQEADKTRLKAKIK